MSQPKEPNAYEKKQAAKVERLRKRSAALKSEATATHAAAKTKADIIPMGQPIHVGHYSEGRDRRFRAKIQDQYRKSFQLDAKANELSRRADRAESNAAISSDDPEAIAKLEVKIAAEEARLARPGLKSFEKRNARGEIARLRARIRDLQDRDQRPIAKPLRFGPAVLTENREDNRIQIRFDDKPSKEVASRLRGRGFVWAPSAGAWQRKLSEGAHFTASNILRDLYGKGVVEASPAVPSRAPRGALLLPSGPAAPKALPPARRALALPPAPRAPLKISPALRSWLKAPQAVQLEIAKTLARAQASTSTAADFMYKARRLVVAEDHGEWSIFNWGDGEPVFYPPPEASLLLPPAPSKPDNISAALKSWLAAPEATQRLVARTLDGARKASTRAASMAYRKQRLIVAEINGAWTITDTDGEEVVYQARTSRSKAPRTWASMTDAQYWNTRNREIYKEKLSAAKKARTTDIKEQRATCKTWATEARQTAKGDARRVAVAESRSRCAAALVEKERAHAATIGEIIFHRVKPSSRPKVKAPPSSGKAATRGAERDDFITRELEGRGLAHLIPLWHKMKGEPRYKGAIGDRAIERFLEGIAEDDQSVDQHQANQIASDDEYACEQAHEQARAGDPLAAQFAAENCDGPRPLRKKGSAAVRTLTMLGLSNPTEAEQKKPKKEKAAKPPKKGAGRSKAQQSLGTTADTAGPQLTIEAAPRTRRSRTASSDKDIPF